MFQKDLRTKDRKLLDTFETKRCVACGRQGAVAHHVKTKGSGGGDEPHNLMPLDTIHHAEVHQVGLLAFSVKYWKVNNWLIANGWTICEVKKKWIHE